jgi:starch synthase
MVNGVNNSIWNPAVDPLLPARYTPANMAGKQLNRTEMLRRFELGPECKGPIFAMVCRLTEQKGVDFVLANSDFFIAQDVRLIVLGTGEKRMEDELRNLAAKVPQKVALNLRHDEAMSHLVEAGSDFFLMPSVFEPCGLNQMYSQGYGTVPIASRVGGLVDTVVDVDEYPATGTGLMCEPNSAALRDALQRALLLFADPVRYAGTQQRGMAKDFNWKSAAERYEQLYQDAL